MRTPAPSNPSSLAGRDCVLVVDDSESNRTLLNRRLSRHGYSVVEADGGRRALELIGKSSFDAVLLDIMMPEMSGLEVLTCVREQRGASELPIIMVTAKSSSDDVVESLRLGANDYVTKPIDFPVLLARLRTQLSLGRLSRRKDEFLRIASHDLKNPLTVIMGAAEILSSMLPPGSTLTQDHVAMLTAIAVRAQTMQRIIEDYLDFQALEDGELSIAPQSVSLNAIASQVVDGQASYAQSKRVELLFRPTELPPTPLDPLRIGQVIENLVSNAIKFAPSGARVELLTGEEPGRQRVEVRDSGPGLTPDDLGKLFVKYARLSNRPTGGEKSSGLGLAICKQLVLAHGGEIGAHNNPDGGATFWFSVRRDA